MKRLIVILMLCLASWADIAVVGAVRGEFKVIRNGSELLLKSGERLQVGDRLFTGKGGYAQVVFVDETILTLGSGADFHIDDYGFGESAPRAKFVSLKGAFRAISGEIGKIAPEKFTVKTRTATMGIRGTRLLAVHVTEDELFCCLSGEVIVYNEKDSTVLRAAEFTTFKEGQFTKPREYTEEEVTDLLDYTQP